MTPTRLQPPFDPDPLDYMCPNCVTPWKCNGPHIPDAYVESESAGPDRGWLWILTVVGASVIIGILIAIAMLAASRSALGPPLPGGRELVRAQTGALHGISGLQAAGREPVTPSSDASRGSAPLSSRRMAATREQGNRPSQPDLIAATSATPPITVIGEPLYVVRDSR